MEIERKFTIKSLPDNLENYPHTQITQAYLCTEPVMRIRKQDEEYVFTYKGKGLMVREEYNLPLTKEAFDKLLPKADGHVISKTRYLIPHGELLIELDLFTSPTDLIMAEVEFPDEESALSFTPPDWFDKDIAKEKISDNEENQLEELLKEYK